MTQSHRVGVNEVHLVKRRLKLENFDHSQSDAIVQAIDELMGVDWVSMDEISSILKLAYDASKVNIDDIEAIVCEHGAAIARGRWMRNKMNRYRFTDRNIRDNKQQEPWSCHRK